MNVIDFISAAGLQAQETADVANSQYYVKAIKCSQPGFGRVVMITTKLDGSYEVYKGGDAREIIDPLKWLSE